MIYFGKPTQCYKCHIKAVYTSWKKLYEQREKVINDLCDRYGFSRERFKAASLLTVAFHDAGKPSLRFQQDMFKIAKNNGWANPHVACQTCDATMASPSLDIKTEPYRHEIISGPASLCVCSILDKLFGEIDNSGFPFEFFAVIGHHKAVNPDSFRREWDRFFGDSEELSVIGYGEDQWNHVMEVAKLIFDKESMSLPNIEWKDIYKEGTTIIEKVKERIDTIPIIVQDAIDVAGNTGVIGQIREIFVLLKSLLISADWEGSSGKEIHSTIAFSADELWKQVRDKIKIDATRTFAIREFQQKLTNLSGHGIAIAPTGSGKTEGAVAWALSNKTMNGKILYVLPNQVLTNSIYERLKKYFGEDKVGLLHSGALLYQILSRSNTDESEQYDAKELFPTDDEKAFHTLNRMMFRPIMVSTVDQILMTAFNGNKRWSVIMGEVMGGAIIFDEVHAYDGHMLALLERVSRELRHYSKMLFMSATMPKNLIAFISKLLGMDGKDHIVKDKTLLQQARNKYVPVTDNRGKFKPLMPKEKISKEVLEDVKEFIRGGKRVAIICNTVKTAQAAYSQLKNIKKLADKTMCLHSRFIAKDRRAKEKKLEKDKSKSREDQSWPPVLVATQVIECGMDIDYDVLFTEGAPLEAIIQRAGRVNRERNTEKGEVRIFKQDETSQKFYPPEITEIALNILKEKANSNPEITEEELINMVEDVYQDRNFENDLRFLNTRRLLDEVIYDIGAVQDLPETDLHTRFVTYKMVEVVPEQFWDDVKEKNQFVIMEHLVKMPLWAYLKAKSYEPADKWKVMKMKYNPEIGGTFEIDLKNEILFV
jgi:CRISPR-associated endonuclease/helicase Cas3